jgi:short-subunit dehydrogenase
MSSSLASWIWPHSRTGALARGLIATAAAGLTVRYIVRQSRRISFEGKVVLITGGSRGLGLILARQLAERRARVAFCARDEAEIAIAKSDIKNHHPQMMEPLGIACDITDREQVKRLVARVNHELGPVDILINNAGMIQVGPQSTMDWSDYETAMRVHFWGPLAAIQAVLPGMLRRQSGRIVNIASIGGQIGVPHLLPYCASKFALVGLSESLRAELASEGIQLSLVCPGLMRTGSHHHARFSGKHRAEFAWFSVGAASPLLAMDADRAARQILNACEYGDPQIVLSWPAQLASWIHANAPGVTAEALALMNRCLPKTNGSSAHNVPGSESHSSLIPGWLTALGDRAARRNNELP